MIDVTHLPKDFTIGCYVPQRQWPDDHPPNGYTAFVLDLKNGVDNAINEAVELLSHWLYGFDTVMVVPSHRHGHRMTGICRVAIELAKGSNRNILDATACLHRAKNITKLSTGGDRCIQTHLDSIQLQNPHLLTQKRILLLDDVRCSGNSLTACSQILKKAMPRSIHTLAFAQSWHEQIEDPEMTMAYLDHKIHTKYQAQKALLDMEEEREYDAISALHQFADR